MNNNDSLSHTKWRCKYHIVFAPKYRRKVIFGKIRVDTVGQNKKAIEQYIRNQLQEDIANDNVSSKEYLDPFTGEKVKK